MAAAEAAEEGQTEEEAAEGNCEEDGEVTAQASNDEAFEWKLRRIID